jgi:hypothetical protein
MIHGNDEQTRRDKTYQRDTERLQTIYNNRDRLEPSVRDLLFDTIEEHRQTSSNTAIHNWLAVHETTIIQSAKNVMKRALQGVRSIKTYFRGKEGGSTNTSRTRQKQSRNSMHIK